jgi:hypothetical protein
MRGPHESAALPAAGRHVAAPPELDSDGLPTQDENGVDLTLIRATLALSPLQRLRRAQAWMQALSTVRRVDRARRP